MSLAFIEFPLGLLLFKYGSILGVCLLSQKRIDNVPTVAGMVIFAGLRVSTEMQ